MGRPALKYWWDFSCDSNEIVLRSDYAGGECLAKFAFDSYADRAIELAEQLISDFEYGRKMPKWSRS